jgi:hypothetical protein
MLDLERRAIAAFDAFGVLMAINYQTIMPPVRGEHVAFGRHWRRHLFEQRVRRPVELGGWTVGLERGAHRPDAAGYHLDERRRATQHLSST